MDYTVEEASDSSDGEQICSTPVKIMGPASVNPLILTRISKSKPGVIITTLWYYVKVLGFLIEMSEDVLWEIMLFCLYVRWTPLGPFDRS